MRVRLTELWNSISGSLWFLPGMMVLASFILAVITLWLDRQYSFELQSLIGLSYASSAEGGRSLLSTIAGSMMTVTGVVFSVTIVTLSLTSSQYGPRLLRNFLNDRGNQIVLGTFLGTFTFCIVVLRTLRDTGEQSSAPEISITVGGLLALASLGVLIYFIHHISRAIQASSILSGVGHDMEGTIDKLFPERIGKGESETRDESFQPALPDQRLPHSRILLHRAGYVRSINSDALLRATVEHDAVVKLNIRPGDYVYENGLIARAWADGDMEQDLADRIRAAITTGKSRTPHQDIDFLVSQFVQVALLALSSGVNNSLVAIEAIDWLGASLARVAERNLPESGRYDEEDNLRVVSSPATFESLLTDAFNPLRESAQSNTIVIIHMLETIEKLVAHCHRPEDLEALRVHASLLRKSGIDTVQSDFDQGHVLETYNRVVRELQNATLQ